jgi:hypothetical protein
MEKFFLLVLFFSGVSASGACLLFWAAWSDARRPYGYWQCPNGHQVSSSGEWRRRYCAECGERMVRREPLRCPDGHQVHRGDNFCSRCGESVYGGTLI